MKKDPAMIKAATLLGKLQHQQGISAEAQAVASFVNGVLLPLLTQPSNSNQYKQAKQSLIFRGRNAKEWMQEQGTLPSYMENY